MTTTAREALSEQLRQLLQREYTLLRELMQVMATERDTLMHQGELDAVLQHKQALLDQVEAATQDRLRWLRREQVPLNVGAILDYVAELDQTGTLTREFSAFAAAAAECQQYNISLSHIIRRRQDFVSRAAASLGVGPDVRQASYAEDGQRLAESARRHLGSA